IVDVQTGASLRSLPDALDDDFSFIAQFDSGQALAVCKVGKEFLLCYEEFAFFIDNFGRRSRPNVFVRWEMRPTLVTFRYPYLVAVNPKFLEIRHMETGVLLSVVRLHKAVCLNPDSKSIVLHIAVKPSGAGLATGTSSQSSTTQPQAADKSGSTKAQSPVAADTRAGNVVPGLAGIDGMRTFPEGNANYYRVIEVRLPPLKTSK
ncbi:RHO1 GDP-GTP exchange protein 2, partial [Linderina pennispora]